MSSVDDEYTILIERDNKGEFHTNDDLADAFFDASMSEEIAIKAALGELNALLESTLQSLAVVPLEKEQTLRNPKRKQLVTDLKFDKLLQLIEDQYEIEVKTLPHFEEIKDLRERVNAYKHRGGFNKPPRCDTDEISFEKIQVDRTKTFQKIREVDEFLYTLLSIGNTK